MPILIPPGIGMGILHKNEHHSAVISTIHLTFFKLFEKKTLKIIVYSKKSLSLYRRSITTDIFWKRLAIFQTDESRQLI